MNRRTFAASAPAALFALVSSTTSAETHMLQAMQRTQLLMQRPRRNANPDADPTDEASSPRGGRRATFSFDDFDSPQSMYVGLLATWTTISSQSVAEFANAARRLADNVLSKAASSQAISAAGVWGFLYKDMRDISAPEPFVDTHDLLLEANRNLERASLYVIDGLTLMDADSINMATDYIGEGTALIEELSDVIPIAIPERSLILPG